MTGVTAIPVTGLPEIGEGTDLAALIAAGAVLQDGDVVVVTSKVVSKSEGRVAETGRAPAIAAETARVVARRGQTTIARTRHGLTLAAAGVDASNAPSGTVVLLPRDPDASARRLRSALRSISGRDVAVVISDTVGRTWRQGQTDIAIGVAGMRPLVDLSGATDRFGNTLEVTAPAVADEVAGLGDLVMGKLENVPVAVVRGLEAVVVGEDGPGAAALVRPDSDDMFGLGSREAVVAAVRRDDPSALAALRQDQVDVGELLAQATSSDVPDLLQPHQVAGGVEISGADDLPTAAALERVVIIATTTQWRVVVDERNAGRCRIVLTSGNGSP